MSYRKGMAIVMCAWSATATARAGDGPGDRHVSGPSPLHRIAPVGGLSPDGRGLLHWWEPDCFPRPCGPDDYCRKPFPRFCWRPAPLSSMSRSTQPMAHFGQRSWADGN
jgi:hypothetical protein